MSQDQPKPATGEWTQDPMDGRVCDGEGNPFRTNAGIVDAHNAALAAEKENAEAASALGVTEQKLANQLAAAVEALKTYGGRQDKQACDAIDAALASEQQLRKQLAAEREKVQTLTEQMQKEFSAKVKPL